MFTQKIPVYYFPTVLVAVDDSQRFLKYLSFYLPEDLKVDIFHDPLAALQQLTTHYSKVNLPAVLQIDPESNHAINIDLTQILELLYDSDRFNVVSTLLIDYAMPGMNGIEFCEKLHQHPMAKLKKIMLTGEADQNAAIRAFNKGILDKFLLKNEENLNTLIQSTVKEMQVEFFETLTEPLVSTFMAEPDYCLENPDFIKEFNQILDYYRYTFAFLLLFEE
jgi:CheY-like chemotaxis protein